MYDSILNYFEILETINNQLNKFDDLGNLKNFCRQA